VDFLKIDGQFIGGLGTDPVDRCMVEAITKVAGALGSSRSPNASRPPRRSSG